LCREQEWFVRGQGWLSGGEAGYGRGLGLVVAGAGTGLAAAGHGVAVAAAERVLIVAGAEWP
jgi:hypothetical protein